MCKETGFATLVGETSGGSTTAPQTMVLPQSKLVVRLQHRMGLKPDGTSFEEEGTRPDVFSLPGLSALETCLMLIDGLSPDTYYRDNTINNMALSQP